MRELVSITLGLRPGDVVPTVGIPLPSTHPFAVPVALAAIDPAALRPHSDRSPQCCARRPGYTSPCGSTAGCQKFARSFYFAPRDDPESGRLLVTSYTHSGLAFEAEDFGDAMPRAVQIAPDFAIAAGLGAEGIAIVLDEYPSINDLSLD
jgi:hypothetical protein